MDIEIRPLSSVTIDCVLDAFQQAFGDYAVSFSREEIKSMLVRRGYTPELSFGAFAGDTIASFLLNGHGLYGGISTCYDCGTGTLPGYRGHGLAGRLFQESLPALKRAGVEQYLLEVLTTNTPAINIYRKAGFEISADYACYNQEVSALTLFKPCNINIDIRPGDAGDIGRMTSLCDFSPSWQNDAESIRRGEASLEIRIAYCDREPVGYCVFDPKSGDVSQIAVSQKYRRQGVATALLSSVVATASTSKVKVLNVAAGCSSLKGFLAYANFNEGLSQYAMVKHIG